MTQVTRREFIRLATLMGGVSLFAGCHLFGEEQPVPKYIDGAPGVDPLETLQGVKNIYTVCALCPGNCGICCRVAEGTVVKIGGNPYHPVSGHPLLPFETPLEKAAAVGGSVCAVGGSGIQTVYDPFRPARPLKRVGPRGSGKWKAITWDQAFSEIVMGGDLFGEGNVEGLKSIKESAGGLQFLLGRADWGAQSFVRLFLAAFPNAVMARDAGILMEERAREAAEAVFGAGTGALDADYGSVRCLVSFGDAPLDSGVPLVSIARRIADARVKGPCMRWVVVDPRLSTSASKSDLWVPVIPGEDVNLVLAIIKALLANHRNDLKFKDEALDKLVADRSTADFAKAAGIGPDIPVKLARMLVAEGPRAAAVPGRGILAQPNGLEVAKAILTINRMVGSVPGSGGLTARSDGYLKSAEEKLVPAAARDLKPTTFGSPAKALLLWESDPVYDNPASADAYFKDRSKLPLFAAISTGITETAALADYILPDTTYLERWDVCVSPPSVSTPGVGVRMPVIGGFEGKTGRYFPILPETRPMEEALIGLSAALKVPGFDPKAKEGIKNAWDYYKQVFPAVIQAMKAGGFPVEVSKKGVAEFLQRGGFFSKERTTARAAVSSPYKAPELKPAPVQSAPKDSLLLLTYTLPFHRSPTSGVNSWLLEILPENRLLINTADARKLGIKQGETVTVEMSDGKTGYKCKAQVAPGIRPGVVALARGFGYRQLGASSQEIDKKSLEADKPRGAGVNAADLASSSGPSWVRVKRG